MFQSEIKHSWRPQMLMKVFIQWYLKLKQDSTRQCSWKDKTYQTFKWVKCAILW